MTNAPAGAPALDTRLYRDGFGTVAMRAIFDADVVERWRAVEAALARAQAAAGLIPAAAEAITAACTSAAIDLEELARGTALVGYPILTLVHQIARAAGPAAATFTGARRRRTSWTPRPRYRCATRAAWRRRPSTSRGEGSGAYGVDGRRHLHIDRPLCHLVGCRLTRG